MEKERFFESEKNPKRSLLSMTAEDHGKIGSTLVGNDVENQLLRNNPEKTLAELLSPEQLCSRIERDLTILDGLHREATQGNALSRRLLQNNLETNLEPDFNYLRSINKLPEEFAQIDLRKRFELP